jgi:hypothetical protein
MVPGAVKFESGAPNEQVGASTAPVGDAVLAALKVTVPANPFAPVTVMSCVVDVWPGVETVIVAVPDAGVIESEELMVMVSVPEVTVVPTESFT